MVNAQNCNCACNLMKAEIEGIKLDLVILNNQLQTRKKSKELNFKSIKEENKKLREIINSSTCERENEVNSLKEKLHSLVSTLNKVEEERDSLRSYSRQMDQ